MRHIVILTQYFSPEMGAPQSRLYETAVGLQQLGWEVCVVTAMPNYPTGKIFNGYRRKLIVKEMVGTISVYRYTMYASNSKQRMPRIVSMISFGMTSLLSFFKLRKFKPDYIFTESPPLTLAATGLLLSKLTGARHVMNVSDIWPLSALELNAVSDGFFYRSLKKLETFLYRHSFACTGQSQQIADYLGRNGCKNVHLFRNGVGLDRFEGLPAKMEHSTFKIVYGGLLGVAQGILALIKSINFKELGAEFHIYGDGAERDEIESFLDNNHDRGVFIHEPVDRDSMPATLMQFDLTIIPLVKSIYGAVPSKMYEAMAAGLPILFAGGGEGAEIIHTYGVGWISAPSDFDNIRETIRNITNLSDSELQVVKNNCLHAAYNVFDRKIQIAELDRFLRNNS